MRPLRRELVTRPSRGDPGADLTRPAPQVAGVILLGRLAEGYGEAEACDPGGRDD
jgi:hypothetical protein